MMSFPARSGLSPGTYEGNAGSSIPDFSFPAFQFNFFFFKYSPLSHLSVLFTIAVKVG